MRRRLWIRTRCFGGCIASFRARRAWIRVRPGMTVETAAATEGLFSYFSFLFFWDQESGGSLSCRNSRCAGSTILEHGRHSLTEVMTVFYVALKGETLPYTRHLLDVAQLSNS